MSTDIIHVVLTECPLIVLGAYRRGDLALIHERTVTGAFTISVVVSDKLPENVIEMLVEEFDPDAETPVSTPIVGDD